MGFADSYLSKHLFKKIDIPEAPSGLLRYIVIIPAFSESNILKTLQSLLLCDKPKNCIEVFVLINYSERASDKIKLENQEIYKLTDSWCKDQKSNFISFKAILAEDLAFKHAGVGLARKILMDAAVSRFNQIGLEEGYILSLDADTLVPPDYFTKIENCILDTKAKCIVFNFAHPVSGIDQEQKIYNAIILYELYLRYYKQILKSTGFPYYHYTIGSSFCVNVNSYIKAGGMNRKQAGEDFYFLHKIFPHNKVFFLSSLILVPSSRSSDRVPFGTGAAVAKIIKTNEIGYKVYNPASFVDLKEFILVIPLFYKCNRFDVNKLLENKSSSIHDFFIEKRLFDKIEEFQKNSSSASSFVKRFYQWFDAFMVIKFLNFACTKYYQDVEIGEAAKSYLKSIGLIVEEDNLLELLEKFRMLDLKPVN